MPGAEWFPGARLSLRGARLPRQARAQRSRSTMPPSCARSPRPPGPSWALRQPASRPACGPRGWARATGWSPTCPTCRRPWPPSWPAPRSAPPGRAARRTSARARWSTASPRSSPRCCWRSTATATTAATSTGGHGGRHRGRDPAGGVEVVTFGYLDGSGWPDAFAPRRRAARVRAAPLRPPAVGALQLGHHRPAQGDRARAGRDPAGAPQEAGPAPGRPARRPRVLVHHHRLDDVELPGRRAAHARGRSCSTTAARGTPTSGCCGTLPRRRA